MQRSVLLAFVLILLSLTIVTAPVSVSAQPEEEAGEEEEEGLEEEELEEEEYEETEEDPQLRPPDVEPLEEEELETEEETEEEGEEEEEEDEDLLEEDSDEEGPSSDVTEFDSWTAPQSIFTLHGYFRVRGELWDSFFIGRDPSPGQLDLPFSFFRPLDRRATPAGGCAGMPEPDPDLAEACDKSSRLRFANTRLRLSPTISLSEDVHVHMTLDVLDNVALGSTPESEVWIPPGGPGGDGDSFTRAPRAPGAPVDFASTTLVPPLVLRNSVQDSIVVRRAWAQVRNRSLGEIRFGRMGWHWGLGMLWNDGEGLDEDYSTDVDRIIGIARVAGFYFAAGWDFANEGFIRYDPSSVQTLPFDATNKDDVRQFVFSAAYRFDPEEQRARLERGDWVLNGGFTFVYRRQFLSSSGVSDPFADNETGGPLLTRREARAFVPDLWAQFLLRRPKIDMRFEMEAALIAGSIENLLPDGFLEENLNLLQFGLAFESEMRILDDRLGIYLNTGYATGDPDVDGLSASTGLYDQQEVGARRQNDRITTFAMHPSHHVDLILWRQILGRMAGAWYFQPGVSYDILRNSFGQLFGARAQLTYSRAAQEVQTYGSDPNLGVELNLSLYYRSEDGPEPLDGFYAQFQYAVLFPLDGLGYPTFNDLRPEDASSLKNAQALRLLLGVVF